MADFAKPTWSLEDARNADFTNYAKLNEKSSKARQNKPFIYPGPSNRSIDGLPTPVRRGFMRSIILGGDVAAAFGQVNAPSNFRLNFQFNPEYIERKVQQSIGAVNPLLQNPTNLTQAVPGTAQFNFTMTFNREQELAQGSVLNIDLNNPEEVQSALDDPGKVGVMHDLAMFDKIIGQGITSDIATIIAKYTKTQTGYINEANASTDTTDTTGTDKQTDATQSTDPKGVEFVEADFMKSVNNNFGNSAFLNPLPVRVVFSDLFMVEGLVVSSAVAFQKFSQKMIPTICQVNVELYALYVGFAKKQAFLTDNLIDWAKGTRADAEKNAAITRTIKTDTRKRVKNVFYVFNNTSDFPTTDTIGITKLLKVPDYNSNGMRVLLPKTTESYYSGNQSVPASRYVTFQQWFNTFASSSMKYPSGTEVRPSIIADYKSKQDSISLSTDLLGYLPVSVYVDYDDQNKPLDADFNVLFTAFVLSKTAGNKTYQFDAKPEPGSKWKLVNEPKLLTKENVPVRSTISKKTKLWKRVYWIKPNTLSASEPFITTTVQLKVSFSATVTNDELPESVLVNFDEGQIAQFSTTDPFFYNVNYSNPNFKAFSCKPQGSLDPRATEQT